jgi:ubiquinol-cytochrome c reductase cytochrome c1 subunit
MTKIKTILMGSAAGILAAGLLLAVASAGARAAEEAAGQAEEHYEIPRQKWTFGGIFGYFDKQQLRRGYKIYKDVCSGCHNLGLLSYRNLGEPGGPEFSPEEVKAVAAEVQVFEGFDEQGNISLRPGRPSDNFVWKFKNAKEAAAAFGGAVPPDLSLMTRARGIDREFAWYAFPLIMLKDLATQYQEQGADYIYALLNGYGEPPAGKKIAEGLNYNRAFPGNQLAMPQPLTDGAVEYGDGTPNTLDQEARDITTFLAWAAEPHLAERKKMGLWVIIYLLVLAGLVFLSKKALWRDVEH